MKKKKKKYKQYLQPKFFNCIDNNTCILSIIISVFLFKYLFFQHDLTINIV